MKVPAASLLFSPIDAAQLPHLNHLGAGPILSRAASLLLLPAETVSSLTVHHYAPALVLIKTGKKPPGRCDSKTILRYFSAVLASLPPLPESGHRPLRAPVVVLSAAAGLQGTWMFPHLPLSRVSQTASRGSAGCRPLSLWPGSGQCRSRRPSLLTACSWPKISIRPCANRSPSCRRCQRPPVSGGRSDWPRRSTLRRLGWPILQNAWRSEPRILAMALSGWPLPKSSPNGRGDCRHSSMRSRRSTSTAPRPRA